MNPDEAARLYEQVQRLANKRTALCNRLIAPARAAANQMKDAGMHRGADELLSILFEMDAVEAELKKLLDSRNLTEILKVLMHEQR